MILPLHKVSHEATIREFLMVFGRRPDPFESAGKAPKRRSDSNRNSSSNDQNSNGQNSNKELELRPERPRPRQEEEDRLALCPRGPEGAVLEERVMS